MRYSLRTRAAQFGLILCSVVILFPIVAGNLAQAGTIGGLPCNHVTDGTFNASPSSTSDATEWGCATVSKQIFPQVGGSGGAVLYADQGAGADNNLYLMYDYTGSAGPSSFFDVFFEVVPDAHSYLVRIPTVGLLQAYERPIGSTAPLAPNGSFDIGPASGWTPLTADDLALAKFQGAVGFGSSPNNPNPHSMAEFQLTINRPAGASSAGAPGVYDPSPAFWSASETGGVTCGPNCGAPDPPISSAIFTLNPDGTSTVLPQLDPNGAPLQQGTATPEPASALVLVSGVIGLLGFRRLRAVHE